MNIYLLTMTVHFNYLDVLKDHFKRKMNTIGTEIMEAVVNIFQMIIYSPGWLVPGPCDVQAAGPVVSWPVSDKVEPGTWSLPQPLSVLYPSHISSVAPATFYQPQPHHRYTDSDHFHHQHCDLNNLHPRTRDYQNISCDVSCDTSDQCSNTSECHVERVCSRD